MYQFRPYNAIDFYKADHRSQYPEGTQLVYANFTPRSDRLANVLSDYYRGGVVVFGIQALIQAFFVDLWNKEFFDKPRDEVVAYFKRRMDTSLGPDAVAVDAMLALHDYGRFPVQIDALPEGSICPIGVPCLTIHNTAPEFFWVTNYVESVMSACLWKPMTSATTARMYRDLLDDYAEKTCAPKDLVQFQGHDFSFRGMSGLEDAVMSGAGHLLSFSGTDTVLSIDFMEDYYEANADEELIGASVPATEHSVMCMGTQGGEIDTFKRLINELYTTGIVSIVSDTWDYWKVITEYLPQLKEDVMARDGKVVIRPDSGDPVRIICGYAEDECYMEDGVRRCARTGKALTPAEVRGSVECLAITFGTTETETGHKLLNEKIGLIYGDSITLARAEEILRRLEAKGFSSGNIVFGIGSYTYEYVTRDTFGFAMKATYGVVDGEGREIFKDPATDSGTKKSAKGVLAVRLNEEGQPALFDQQAWSSRTSRNLLQPVFVDGNFVRRTTLAEIRERLAAA